MKTYKLIKTYPGSFPIGHLAILDDSKVYYNLGTTTRDIKYIEEHPEYWQEICPKCKENIKTCTSFGCKKKKDYEILSFSNAQNPTAMIRTLRPNGLYIHNKFSDSHFKDMENSLKCFSIESLLQNLFYVIHSVKRLSDGEIFTIGDIIKPDYGLNSIITGFELKPEMVYPNNMLKIMTGEKTFYYLQANIKKVEKKIPLFTTEDGVNIFDNNSFIGVYDYKIYNCCTVSEVVKNKVEGWKYFSTKKAAENYVKMNKLCLSLKEVTELWTEMYGPDNRMKEFYSGYYNKLTKIVKQKIK